MSPSQLWTEDPEPSTLITTKNFNIGSQLQISGSPSKILTHSVMRYLEIQRCCSPITTPSPTSLWAAGASVTVTLTSASPATRRTRPVAASVFANTGPLATTARPVCLTTGTGAGSEQPLRMPTLASLASVTGGPPSAGLMRSNTCGHGGVENVWSAREIET